MEEALDQVQVALDISEVRVLLLPTKRVAKYCFCPPSPDRRQHPAAP